MNLTRKVRVFIFWLKGKNIIFISFLGVLISMSGSIAISLISRLFFHTSIQKNFTPFKNVREELIVGCIIAPVLETIIVQYAIIESFREKVGNKYAIVISAVAFGIMHVYNFFYFLWAFFVGILYGVLYFIGKEKGKPILTVLLSHMLNNLLVLILDIALG